MGLTCDQCKEKITIASCDVYSVVLIKAGR